MDRVSDKVRAELESLAARHPTYETFMQDVHRLGEAMWHNARVHAEQDALVGTDEVPQPDPETPTYVPPPAQDTPEPEDAKSAKATAK